MLLYRSLVFLLTSQKEATKMNRTATVFLTIIATLTGVLGLGQSIALGTGFELLPIAGIIGGSIPFVCGVAST